ncbi:MAG: fibronectin type III domain-containing protein, partial [Bacteroidetes bacterium]|nr:fibronectin type III domain-containing protein [Bacteroidota bacterium]
RVRAINSVGSSGWSNTANATTASPTATVPGVPTSLTATASGQTIINLSWTAPTSNGGAAISGYRIEVSTNGGSSFSQLVASQSGTSYSHTGLTAGTARRYRVRAINSVGSSGWSNTANATTAAATAPGAPTSLTAAADGQTTIDLSWTAPTSDGGAAISGYRIDVSTNGGSSFSQLVASHSTTSYSHTGLTAGTARHYRVRAINSVGSSGWSNTANATTASPTATVPGVPTSLTATASAQTIINLSWTAPTSDGGAAISGYRIEVSTNGGSTFSQLVASHSTTSYSHTGLTAGTARHYRVRAINSVGNSGWSNTANATTAAATAPSAPRSLAATASGQTIINLSWSAPSSTGGASITGYRIQWSTDGNNPWTNLTRTNPTATATTDSHTGLTAGTTRYYRVYAINSVGDSPASSVVSATTATGTTTGIVVSFDVSSSQVNEDGVTATVQVNVNPASPSSLTMTYSLGGTATQNTDYTIQGSGSITVAANATSANLSIAITNDPVDESDETVIMTLTSGTGYDIGTQNSHTLTIVDDDIDVQPLSFATMILNQSFVKGVPIDEVVLPGAVGGTLPYRYALTPDPPAGLEFDASTQTLSGTPSESMSATSYTYTVTDDDNATAIQTFTIEVTTPQDLVLADSIENQMYPVGKAIVDLVLPSAMGGAPPYTYTFTPDPPKGLTFEAETRTLSGTPPEVMDSQLYTYTVEDRAGTSSKQDFEIEVYTITFTETIGNQSYPRGQVIDPLVLPEVTGGVPPIQYTLTLLDLPFYLKFDLATRTISGTPLQITPPTSLTYTAMDHHGAQDSLVFSVEVISPVHIDETPGIPLEFRGYSNYPNPFHHSTNLVFDLPWPARVQVEVMDVTGRRLVSIPSVYLTAGWGNEIELSDLNLPSGPYLFRIQATSLDDRSSSVYVGNFMSVR